MTVDLPEKRPIRLVLRPWPRVISFILVFLGWLRCSSTWEIASPQITFLPQDPFQGSKIFKIITSFSVITSPSVSSASVHWHFVKELSGCQIPCLTGSDSKVWLLVLFLMSPPSGRLMLVVKDAFLRDFNSFGSRRGNDAVMARGTFGNIRLVNSQHF